MSTPVGPGSVAHRLDYYSAPNGNDRHGNPQYVRLPKPRCQANPQPGPDGVVPRFAEYSAGWADKLDAQACSICFPKEG